LPEFDNVNDSQKNRLRHMLIKQRNQGRPSAAKTMIFCRRYEEALGGKSRWALVQSKPKGHSSAAERFMNCRKIEETLGGQKQVGCKGGAP